MTQSSPKTDYESNLLAKPKGFRAWRPGTVPYRDAQSFQDKLVAQRHDLPYDLLILLEHHPVITLGRSADNDNLLWGKAQLAREGFDCVSSRRGGDITLHSPGQLVGYPIVDLNYYRRDLHSFLRQIEKIIIATLADFSLKGKTVTGKTGVWVEDRKIASIGIAVKRWVSYHGFALNINNDLSSFDAIVPCGLTNVTMTSMQRELGCKQELNDVAEALLDNFGRVMQRQYLGEFDGRAPEQKT